MTDRDVDFLFEIGSLRHVRRNWTQFGGCDFANVAEHSFRVAWLAVVLSVSENADPARAALLALAHDVPETRVGDRNYVQRVHTTQAVEQALAGILDETGIEKLGGELWREWSAGATLEAQVAHDADALDCDLELRERSDAGATLPNALSATRVIARSNLRTRSARELWDRIQHRTSHDWHLTARNRLNAGDWSIPTEGAP